MSYKLIYSPFAIRDIDITWAEVWSACQDLDTAERYMIGLKEAIKSKSAFPKSGVPLNFLGEFTGIYYVRFKEYIAFYHITENNMYVDRILFARSDYMKTLFGYSDFTPEDVD